MIYASSLPRTTTEKYYCVCVCEERERVCVCGCCECVFRKLIDVLYICYVGNLYLIFHSSFFTSLLSLFFFLGLL